MTDDAWLIKYLQVTGSFRKTCLNLQQLCSSCSPSEQILKDHAGAFFLRNPKNVKLD